VSSAGVPEARSLRNRIAINARAEFHWYDRLGCKPLPHGGPLRDRDGVGGPRLRRDVRHPQQDAREVRGILLELPNARLVRRVPGLRAAVGVRVPADEAPPPQDCIQDGAGEGEAVVWSGRASA
jgi:hypothetical protein